MYIEVIVMWTESGGYCDKSGAYKSLWYVLILKGSKYNILDPPSTLPGYRERRHTGGALYPSQSLAKIHVATQVYTLPRY